MIEYDTSIDGLSEEAKQLLNSTKNRKQQAKTSNETDAESTEPQQRLRIVLKFKKYLFQEKTILAQ